MKIESNLNIEPRFLLIPETDNTTTRQHDGAITIETIETTETTKTLQTDHFKAAGHRQVSTVRDPGRSEAEPGADGEQMNPGAATNLN